MLEGIEFRTPEKLVWPSVPTKIASLPVQVDLSDLRRRRSDVRSKSSSESKGALTTDVPKSWPAALPPIKPPSRDRQSRTPRFGPRFKEPPSCLGWTEEEDLAIGRLAFKSDTSVPTNET